MRQTLTIAACAMALLGVAGCADTGLFGNDSGGSGSSAPAVSGSGSSERNSVGDQPYYPGTLENPGVPSSESDAPGAN
jgi:hypothetical protein